MTFEEQLAETQKAFLEMITERRKLNDYMEKVLTNHLKAIQRLAELKVGWNDLMDKVGQSTAADPREFKQRKIE